ncbi:phospholipase [Prevotella sp. oral taxon 820]|uniref:patatin-like phospholipase family protein n=1 Tax=Prevotella sp. oral taxon 820 TaxID=2081962 RepID=UPI000D1E0BB3|nr:phospholipase [Prevotella sp. oral taxon 820]
MSIRRYYPHEFSTEPGIPIDYIAGTSIGSIVGGLYATGSKADDIERLFRSQEWKSLLGDRNLNFKKKFLKKQNGKFYFFGYPIGRRGSTNSVAVGRFGAMRGDRVVQLLDSLTRLPDSICFDSLPIPFRCVAVDIHTLREVVLDRGKLSVALRASMAIPGAFKPVIMGDSLLVDGGVLNNLPVDVVRRMGADIVIAIDLTQRKHATPRRTLRPRKTKTGRLIQWLKARPDIAKYNHNRTACDLYLNPDLKGFDATRFVPDKIDALLRRGDAVGKAFRPALMKLKKSIMP